MKTLAAVVAILFLAGVYLGWRERITKVETVSLPAIPPPQPDTFALTVVIKDKGEFVIDDVRMDFDRVKKLIAEKKWDERSALKVKRESKAAFQDAVAVLDFARQCGVVQVSLE
jgi:biopolymer transport protein ExbD